jgi:hypothetical protein
MAYVEMASVAKWSVVNTFQGLGDLNMDFYCDARQSRLPPSRYKSRVRSQDETGVHPTEGSKLASKYCTPPECGANLRSINVENSLGGIPELLQSFLEQLQIAKSVNVSDVCVAFSLR